MLGRYCVQYFNSACKRTRTLWEGRRKAALVDSDNHALTCYSYIELHPVRAGIVINRLLMIEPGIDRYHATFPGHGTSRALTDRVKGDPGQIDAEFQVVIFSSKFFPAKQ
jgi:hypothetical protein